jgi:hypothetical protein
MKIIKNLINSDSNINLRILLVLTLGVILRLLMPLRGYNVDAESWRIVADIVNQNGNVYAETWRYPYGPVWAQILHVLDKLPFGLYLQPIEALRWKAACFLTLVDVGIFFFLFRVYGLMASVIFFLNPISIIITGYQIQLDNLAVLVGMISVFIIQNKKNNLNLICGLIVMGLSLCVKHLFFIFPLWLAFKEKLVIKKLLIIFIPFSIFLLSFIPYLPEGLKGVVDNVLLYRSWNHNAPFWKLFGPSFLVSKQFTHFPLFVGSLLILGLIWKSRKLLDSLHLYLVSLVNFASSIGNHYLAICVPSISVNWNWGYAIYTLVVSIHLLFDADALHLQFMGRQIGAAGHHYYLPIFFLTLGLYIQVFGKKGLSRLKNRFIQLKKWIFVQIKEQLINAYK